MVVLFSGQNGGCVKKGSSEIRGQVMSSPVLTHALYQGGVYDHLNVGGLGCLEVICRRIAVLLEVHSQPS